MSTLLVTFHLLFTNNHTETSQSDAAQSEDIDMHPPSLTAVEVASILFAEIQKFMVNGKDFNYILLSLDLTIHTKRRHQAPLLQPQLHPFCLLHHHLKQLASKTHHIPTERKPVPMVLMCYQSLSKQPRRHQLKGLPITWVLIIYFCILTANVT